MNSHPYAKKIWNKLMVSINNPYGVAALMGNLRAESGLYPYRLQGDFSDGYETSKTYTNNVDNGTISEYDFVHNGPNGGGYGLAQWTYHTRKQALYDKYKSGGYSSIGDVDLACDFLIIELNTLFPSIMSTLKTTNSIRTASDLVLHDFENPADQSESVEILRCELGQEVYNAFSGSSVTPDSPVTPTPSGNKSKLSKLLLYAIATDI